MTEADLRKELTPLGNINFDQTRASQAAAASDHYNY